MKLFLSWSGEVSHQIAQKLYAWLPMVIQKIDPYISSEIEKGSRWNTDIAKELDECSFGIACVTRDNISAPWLLFEAGALSKSVEEGRLTPLLLGIDQSDIQKSPLTQFQMTKFEKGEFEKLLKDVNLQLGDERLDEKILEGVFNALWPDLDSFVQNALKDVKEQNPTGVASASADKMMGAVEELLTNSRAITQLLSSPDRLFPESYVANVAATVARYQSDVDPKTTERIYQRARMAEAILDQARQASAEEQGAILDRLGSILHEMRVLVREMVFRKGRYRGNFFRERPQQISTIEEAAAVPVTEEASS